MNRVAAKADQRAADGQPIGSIVSQLGMEQQHRKTVPLAEELLGYDLNASGALRFEPYLGFTFLTFGKLIGLEPVTTRNRVLRRRLSNPRLDPGEVFIAVDPLEPAMLVQAGSNSSDQSQSFTRAMPARAYRRPAVPPLGAAASIAKRSSSPSVTSVARALSFIVSLRLTPGIGTMSSP